MIHDTHIRMPWLDMGAALAGLAVASLKEMCPLDAWNEVREGMVSLHAYMYGWTNPTTPTPPTHQLKPNANAPPPVGRSNVHTHTLTDHKIKQNAHKPTDHKTKQNETHR